MLTITDSDLFKGLFVFLGTELVIIIIWFSVGPLLVVRTIDLAGGRIIYTCGSTTLGTVFFWILFGLLAALLLAGCFVAYFTRSIPTNFNESKSIALAIYNVTIAATISIGIAAGLPEPNVISLATTIGICFTTFVTLLTLMLPKLRFVFFLESMQRSIETHQEKLKQDIMWLGRQLDELRLKTQSQATDRTASGLTMENSKAASTDPSRRERDGSDHSTSSSSSSSE